MKIFIRCIFSVEKILTKFNFISENDSFEKRLQNFNLLTKILTPASFYSAIDYSYNLLSNFIKKFYRNNNNI
jgi:hypothetical protein